MGLRRRGLGRRGLGVHRPAVSRGRSVPRLRRRGPRPGVALLGLTGLLALGVLLAGCGGGNGGHAPPAGGSGEEAAKLGSSPLLERSEAQFRSDLAALKGRVVVINFWASWCGPCKAEMPALQQASKEYAGKPVTFIGVDSSDVRNRARKLLADLNVTYPTVYDKTGLYGGIATSWSVASLPQTWFVARDGSRSGRIPRPLSVADLRSRIDQLLTAA